MTDQVRSPPGAAPAALAAHAVTRSPLPTGIEARRRLVAESLRVGNPGSGARDLPVEADPRHECQVTLKVTQIRPYEHNPRRSAHERFAEIKASIRATGVRTPLTVTRRPGEAHLIVEAGGNTRLLAIQQLWAETGDPRFETLTVLFRPWRSESHVLAAHLVENELRGEMTFWDRACGVANLKRELEAERCAALSLRELADALKTCGLSRDHVTLASYVFAAERLRLLGDAFPDLSGLDVKTIQPRLNALRRHVKDVAGLSEVDLYARVLDPAFRELVTQAAPGGKLSAVTVCDACETAVARYLGQSVPDLLAALIASTRGGRGSVRTAANGESVTGGGEPPDEEGVEPAAPLPVRSANRRGVTVQPRRSDGCSGLRRNDSPSPGVGALAQELAEAAGLADLVRSDPVAPLGFRVLDSRAAQESGAAAYVLWVLRLLSEVSRERMPPQSWEQEAGRVGRDGDVAPDAAGLLTHVLADADPITDALWRFLCRVREVCVPRVYGEPPSESASAGKGQ